MSKTSDPQASGSSDQQTSIPVTVSIGSYGGLYIGNPPDKSYVPNATGLNLPAQVQIAKEPERANLSNPETIELKKTELGSGSSSSSTQKTAGNQMQGTSGDNIPPEVYAYNVVYDQDPDILNQGTFTHIQNYFARKELESHTSNDAVSDLAKRVITSKTRTNGLSINSVFIIIQIVFVILFLWILWDFIDQK